MQRRAAKYDSEIACHFPILFHKWFLTKFRDPTAWFESR
jgi:phosphatidylinositol kinase/protein kinase (PI-3  family)